MEREEGRREKSENGWEKREFIDARMDAYIKIICPPFSGFFTFGGLYISLSLITVFTNIE